MHLTTDYYQSMLFAKNENLTVVGDPPSGSYQSASVSLALAIALALSLSLLFLFRYHSSGLTSIKSVIHQFLDHCAIAVLNLLDNKLILK